MLIPMAFSQDILFYSSTWSHLDGATLVRRRRSQKAARAIPRWPSRIFGGGLTRGSPQRRTLPSPLAGAFSIKLP
jgi:hypothetical protein